MLGFSLVKNKLSRALNDPQKLKHQLKAAKLTIVAWDLPTEDGKQKTKGCLLHQKNRALGGEIIMQSSEKERRWYNEHYDGKTCHDVVKIQKEKSRLKLMLSFGYTEPSWSTLIMIFISEYFT